MITSIDTGGTKTYFAVFDKGQIIFQERYKTEQNFPDYKKCIEKSLLKFSELHPHAKVKAVNFSLPGIIDNDKFIHGGNLKWEDVDFEKEFSPIFKNVIISIENDANAGAIYESTKYPDKKVMYLTISTGIGGGFAKNQTVIESLRRAEIGSMKYLVDGEFMNWEKFASGKSIYQKYGFVDKNTKDEVWDEVVKNLAYGLLCLIPVVNPDKIVCGGSMMNFIEDKVLDKLSEKLNQELNKENQIFNISISKSDRPDMAVVYGGYEIAKAKLPN